jgi:hypothetical protein
MVRVIPEVFVVEDDSLIFENGQFGWKRGCGRPWDQRQQCAEENAKPLDSPAWRPAISRQMKRVTHNRAKAYHPAGKCHAFTLGPLRRTTEGAHDSLVGAHARLEGDASLRRLCLSWALRKPPSSVPPNTACVPPNPATAAPHPSLTPRNPTVAPPNLCLAPPNPCLAPPNLCLAAPRPGLAAPNMPVFARKPAFSGPKGHFRPFSSNSLAPARTAG